MTNCEACKRYRPTQAHHFVPRVDLRKSEYKDDRYIVRLCWRCHQEAHFSPITSGYAFYVKYELLDKLSERCDNDTRWLRRIAKGKEKHENKV